MLLEKIEKYVADYDVIPVKKEIYADLVTPIALLQKNCSKEKTFLPSGKCRRRREMGTVFVPRIRPCYAGFLHRDKIRVTIKQRQETKTVDHRRFVSG